MSKRATRLTEDWTPDEEFIEIGYMNGLTRAEARAEAIKMRDWSLSSKSGAKLDWRATWRNWSKSAAERLDRLPRKAQDEQIAPTPSQSLQTWKNAQGKQKTMLEAMRAQGCPEDILDKMHSYGFKVTEINAPYERPTAFFRTHEGEQVFLRAASGYAHRAGYNKVCYPNSYMQRKMEKPNWCVHNIRARQAEEASA